MLEPDDVVRFTDGPRLMSLWGDRVTIDEMFVQRVTDAGVEVSSAPYTFTFPASELVKVGNTSDMRYETDPTSPNYGDEVYVWFPELNEELAQQRSTDEESTDDTGN